ncbi:hypothetical protein CLOSTHATH_06035 [Hungatella hathewayi DSM 13479]|uniref:Uncharacterized protein n=1 Tax=Hungatella hathewayi DSM 13479 TaxID=566550 RepID=D3AQX9_9FIRM|nr:hypothetical protein CLOSTHATH_06035 [Hungatella hathewayi DSM 13479]
MGMIFTGYFPGFFCDRGVRLSGARAWLSSSLWSNSKVQTGSPA